MTTKLSKQVREFHEKFGITVRKTPTVPSAEEMRLRAKLIMEEAIEVLEAMGAGEKHLEALRSEVKWTIRTIYGDNIDLVKVADGFADLDYVVEGARSVFGIDGEPIANIVHAANMRKVGGKRAPDGKVLKPEGWMPPDVDIGTELLRQKDAADELEVVQNLATGPTASSPNAPAPTGPTPSAPRRNEPRVKASDATLSVDGPDHYLSHPSGVEPVDIVEWLSSSLANVIEYVWRAPYKGDYKKDMTKALWYAEREEARLRLHQGDVRILVLSTPVVKRMRKVIDAETEGTTLRRILSELSKTDDTLHFEEFRGGVTAPPMVTHSDLVKVRDILRAAVAEMTP